MHKTILLIGLFFFSLGIHAQHTVEVPSVIQFADIRLELSPQARKKIQTDVDALTRYEKYFNAKVDKVDSYLPLIEQVLREERVPEDIKYLVIQESALVGDAVSSSNAVGYWQFKAPTGREVGLTINNEVDERMNIITATQGAARYFKNNNTFFDNWLYALLAYYAGPGGALKIADKKYYGAREMKLDGNTHWYVIKYLAHKIAFEQAVGKNPKPETMLFTYTDGNGKTLAQIAKEFNLEASELEPYNKWVRKNRIPDDKTYYVIVPDHSGTRIASPLAEDTSSPKTEKNNIVSDTQEAKTQIEVENTNRYPLITQGTRWGKKLTLINDIPGIVANDNDNIRSISQKADVSPSRLVKYNDLTSKQSGIVAGKPYYLKRKRNKAPVHYHVVEPGETLWSVSQRFGIKLSKLLRNNRMRKEEEIKPGLVLWLRFIRPAHIPEEYRDIPQPDKQLPDQNKIKAPSSLSNVNTKVQEVNEQPSLSSDYSSAQANEQGYTPVTSPSVVNPPSGQLMKKEDEQKQINKPDASASNLSLEKEKEEEQTLVPSVSSEKPAGTPAANPEYHTVKAGETLYSIARQYDLTIPQLTSYNNISWEGALAVGQKLRLKAPDAEADKLSSLAKHNDYLVHEVKSGETMYKVARQYEVTIKDLMEWNDKEDFDVSIGEKLKVRKK